MPERTPEDRLREQYFNLLPEIRRVAEHLEAEVKYHILPIPRQLHRFEQIAVISRIKECDVAVDSLRRRQTGKFFDPRRAESHTLLDLKDLAGVRVLAFPRARRTEVHEVLRGEFAGWHRDPFHDDPQEALGYKYSGFLDKVSNRVRGEFQIVSMLVGLFWDVEHSTLYKPTPELRGVARSLAMQERNQEVLRSLAAFEEEFEKSRSETRKKKKKKSRLPNRG
jgi:ppGpp synthetase/RelA/SpoT-type nucleotidyltranferase